MQIYERVFGENHPGIATVCNNLAMVYEEKGEYKKAENLYKKSIWIREKVLGEENPDTATAYYNIASMYGSKGEYKIAISYYLKAYNILLFKMGINHPITQIVYRNFKMTYHERNPKGNFEQWLREQLREIRKTWFRVIRNETEI